MKSICSILAITLVSFSSLACPDFSGEWQCDDGDATKTLTSMNNSASPSLKVVDNYDNENITYFINDREQRVEDGGTYIATCDAKSVTVKGKQYSSNDKTDFLEVTFSFISTGADTMILDVLSSNDDGIANPNLDPISCKKLAL